jgi:hypothetical protein
MTQEQETILRNLWERAQQISVDLRELDTDLTRQMDLFGAFGEASRYAPLENAIKDVVFRAKLLDQAATVFGFSVTRATRPRTKVVSDGKEN